MGTTHGPEDVLDRKKRIEVSLRDLNPGVREIVLNIVNSWSGKKSMEDLKRIIGEEKARRIMEELDLSEL